MKARKIAQNEMNSNHIIFPHANSPYAKASKIKHCDTNDETKFEHEKKEHSYPILCLLGLTNLFFTQAFAGE